MKKIGILVIAIILIIGIWYFISISPVSKNSEEKEITIDLGTGANKIAEILKENNIIRSKTAFKR